MQRRACFLSSAPPLPQIVLSKCLERLPTTSSCCCLIKKEDWEGAATSPLIAVDPGHGAKRANYLREANN
jgi:hypothetical protein